MPYSDDFIPMHRTCIMTTQDGRVRVMISVWIRWLHKPFLVKGQIDKAATQGLQETASQILEAIQEELVQGREE
ncbi:hypothetical protein HK102_012647 [Quaeritorhiza haematococci]|nr:hypothetical protein HK102_012647 [Quaeritorhiza haematococci]